MTNNWKGINEEWSCARPALRRGLLWWFFALSLLLPGSVALAQEKVAPENQDAASETGAPVDAGADAVSPAVAMEGSNRDLLMFWEEKELYVQTATRTAKPISQVAENMEVITAKDIEDMNAHTVDEVLSKVPGVFVDFETNDFNSGGQLHIQGSASRHVTVLVDGVVWNFVSDGHAETCSIPVGIIDRIEIIKGPASSTWGSGLGGVINIITKNAGDSTIPKGMAFASYGQANSRDFNAQLFGKAGGVGYFLYAGRLASDGLANHRNSTSDSVYGKFTVSPLHDMDVTFTVGYSTSDLGAGAQHNPSPVGTLDTDGGINLTAFHATGALDYRFSPKFTLKAEMNTLRYDFKAETDFTSPNDILGVSSGDIFNKATIRDRATSGNLRLVYTGDIQTAVAGFEASDGSETNDILMPWRKRTSDVSAGGTRWALFSNDTVTLGNFAITPGIRFDHDSVSGNYVSPSLGTTYQFSEHSIARVSIAKGFTRPTFAMTSGGGVFWLANPGLTAEQGWSYQGGVESSVLERVNLKGTLFRHDIDKAISDDPDRTTGKYINVGKIVRQGYEVSAESAPLYNTSLKLSNSYVHISPDAPFRTINNYSYQVGVKYDDRKAWLGQLTGTYLKWDLADGVGRDGYFVWDANLNRRFSLGNDRSAELFFNVHNIFAAPYTTLVSQVNPGRWVEGGVKLRF
ncbi:TonB-dependent receptor [Geomonas sp.]|uniref:TonB-dependent receptor plug domain-containing protein n=1 Tax=Geomonas sp. TaxID=2651584 RepID=UPI002B46AED5|nr:TonB-dependent receptor [Geomonas sp.]HJV36020.1 TonB-dependent receptor [Geomonas sp.]